MFAVVTLCALSSASALITRGNVAASSTSLNAMRSKSVPFMEQPPALDGTSAGDVGFDPLGLTSYWADVSYTLSIRRQYLSLI